LDTLPDVVIGVDLGGTNIKIALVDPKKQQILKRGHLKTLAERGPDKIVADIGHSLMELWSWAQKNGFRVAAVGVGSAGIIRLSDGVVITSPNLPGWNKFPLGERLGEQLQLPVFIENDVNCICYGEYWLGAGHDLGDFLGVAPGTGVGGCLMIGGKAWAGPDRSAGEIGHMTIRADGELCRCGNRGCLETLASGSWLVWRAEERLRGGEPSSLKQDLEENGGLEAENIYHAAKSGDKLAQELFHLLGSSMAIAIANVVHLVGIRSVLIGGGLANAWEVFVDSLTSELQQRLTLVPSTEVKVVRAKLGDEAGALGAAYFAGCQMALVSAEESR
jgi:glucokinase